MGINVNISDKTSGGVISANNIKHDKYVIFLLILKYFIINGIINIIIININVWFIKFIKWENVKVNVKYSDSNCRKNSIIICIKSLNINNAIINIINIVFQFINFFSSYIYNPGIINSYICQYKKGIL